MLTRRSFLINTGAALLVAPVAVSVDDGVCLTSIEHPVLRIGIADSDINCIGLFPEENLIVKCYERYSYAINYNGLKLRDSDFWKVGKIKYV